MRRRRSIRSGHHQHVELNVIPLIDVVFFLLVFYVISTSFTQETAVPIDRPHSSQASVVSGSFVAVAISKTGSIHLGPQVLTLAATSEAVRAALREQAADQVVIIPDQQTPTGTLLAVMDACELAGAASVNVAAQRATP